MQWAGTDVFEAAVEMGLALLRQTLLFAALLVPLEVLWPARAQRRLRFGVGTDLLYAGLTTVVLGTAGALLLSGMSLACRLALPDALPAAMAALPLAIQLAFVVLLAELGGYWTHRLSHTVPLLWRFHAVHHSPRELDWLSGHRQHPVEVLWLVGVAHLPVAVLGFDTSSVLLFILFQKLHTAFVHSNVRLPAGRWERWFAGPRFHHWHHSRDGRVENLASLLPWMDRVFGTWRLPQGQPARLGVQERIPTDIIGQLRWPFRRRAYICARYGAGRWPPRSA